MEFNEDVLTDELCYDLADFFKIFGDSTRIKILYCLYLRGEMNVSELVEAVGMNQSAISHQLRLLRQNDIVKFKKNGKSVIYSLDDDHVNIVLEKGIEHIRHKNGYEEA
jgi:ArsR family transcriptional regulator